MTFVENESELQNAMKNLTLEKRLIGIYANRHLEYEYVRQQFVSTSIFVMTYQCKFRRQKSRNYDLWPRRRLRSFRWIQTDFTFLWKEARSTWRITTPCLLMTGWNLSDLSWFLMSSKDIFNPEKIALRLEGIWYDDWKLAATCRFEWDYW